MAVGLLLGALWRHRWRRRACPRCPWEHSSPRRTAPPRCVTPPPRLPLSAPFPHFPHVIAIPSSSAAVAAQVFQGECCAGSDVWSLGLCVLEMATAEHPWPGRAVRGRRAVSSGDAGARALYRLIWCGFPCVPLSTCLEEERGRAAHLQHGKGSGVTPPPSPLHHHTQNLAVMLGSEGGGCIRLPHGSTAPQPPELQPCQDQHRDNLLAGAAPHSGRARPPRYATASPVDSSSSFRA